jgi:hypothetical protein
MEVRKSGYIFRISTRKNKKYDAYDMNGKYIASFGDRRYQHYRDKIGLWDELDHNDKTRRERYYMRHGKQAKYESPKWFSHNFLW